tara:strand:- start:264 stop:446 length:183 start_codon:yes stop_codon:yes gene_type:complete
MSQSSHENDFREWMQDESLTREDLVGIEQKILDCEHLTFVQMYELIRLLKTIIKEKGDKS